MRNDEAATWRLHPAVERELAEEKRQMTFTKRTVWTLSLTFVSLCPFSCLALLATAFIGPFFAIFAFLALAGLGLEIFRRSKSNRSLAIKRWVFMRDQHQAVDGWIVEMTVYQGAALTGRDWGTVWFEDEKLYFIGERTSFGLLSSQVRSDLRPRWVLDARNLVSVLQLDANTAAGGVSIGLDPLQAHESGEEDCRAAPGLAAKVQSWRRQEARGTGQLPPLAIGPDAPSIRLLAWKMVLGLSLWIALLTLFVAMGVFAGWWLVFPMAVWGAILICLWPGAWALHLRYFALRDRRRLERNLP